MLNRLPKFLALFVFALSGTFLWQDVSVAQVIYQGPAFGTIAGGAPVSTGQFDNIPETIDPGGRKKVHNPFWEKYDPLPYDDIYNSTPPAAPMGSNLFYDPGVSNLRQVSDPPAIMMDFQANSMTNSIPPDPIVAAGPNHIIAMVNTSFIIYDKQGNNLFQRSADQWFQNVLPYSGLFDPIVVYDHFEERWVQCWDLQNDNNQTGYWAVSVSDDSDPMGEWYNFVFPAHLNGTTNAFNWGDYQKVGYDHQAVYISGRQFGFGTGFFYCKVRIIPKSQLYAGNGGPVDYTDFWNFRDPNNPGVVVDGPPIAATHLDSTDNKGYLVVDSPYNTSSFITLWTIQDPLGASPVVTGVNIPTTAAPPAQNGNQLGGGSPRIDVGRRSYRNAVYKDGHIWTSCPIGGGTNNLYTFARYVRIDVNSLTAIEDAALGANGFYYLYPAAMVDEDNNLIMVFTRTADTEYAGAAFTGRRAGDPPGLSPSVMLKEGEGNYVVTFGTTRNRWGDYMGVALDPQNPGVIWGMMEYVAAVNTWGNWIGAFTYRYSVSGIVEDAVSSNPIEFANLEMVETGRVIETDVTGTYSFGAPSENVTLNVSAFAYQDTTIALTLTPNVPEVLDITLQPQIEATLAGQVRDPVTGNGIVANLEFYAEGNPYPGPYLAAATDANGNYSVTTIIGNYDIRVYPETPYPYTELKDVVLTAGGLTQNIDMNPADVLLVNGDANSAYADYYTAALTNITKSYHLWDVQLSGIPTASQMAEYPSGILIWYSGDSNGSALSQAAQDELLAHLNNNGKVFLTGQDMAEEANGSPLLNSLGLAFAQNSAVTLIVGTAGNIGDGLVFLTSGTGGAGNQTSRDQLSITDSSTTQTAFTYSTVASAIAGVTYANGSRRAVFLGFGWEAINDVVKREALLANAIEYLEGPTGIDNVTGVSLPAEFELAQNYPNPFNPSTTIRFSIPQASRVDLAVFNSLGQKVRSLVQENLTAGTHKVTWDGRDNAGNPVTSGVYFYKINAGNKFSDVKKMLILK